MKVTIQRPDNRTLEEELEIIKTLGKGDFNAYFQVESNGLKRFMKTYWDSSVCAGSTSRNILRNEAKILNDNNLDSFFYGWAEIKGRLCLLFDDAGNHDSLEKILNVTYGSDGDALTKPTAKINEEITANATHVYHLDQVYDIISQLLEKVKVLHQKSIVHMDISPANVQVRSLVDSLDVKLFDVGIARRQGKKLTDLYNGAEPGKVSGTYYSAGEDSPLHNRLYSPPTLKEDYLQAECSIDTYMVANLLCLMLTGKNSGYWKENKSREPGKFMESLRDFVKSYSAEKKMPEDEIGALAEKLGFIIVKGTSSTVSERYEQVDGFIKDLQATGITPVHREKIGEVPCILPSIPPMIKDYASSRETPAQQQVYQQLDQRYSRIIGSIDERLQALAQRGAEQRIPELNLVSPDISDKLNQLIELEGQRRVRNKKTFRNWLIGTLTGVAVGMAVYVMGPCARDYVKNNFSGEVHSPSSVHAPISSPASPSPPSSLPPAPPAPQPIRRLVYSETINGNEDIYIKDEDGGNVARLTTYVGRDWRPVLSFDGQRIAFVSSRGSGESNIWLMNADGSNQTMLASSGRRDDYPAWSPDGQKIAFASDWKRNWDIYTIDISHNTVWYRLTENRATDWSPSWSPNGEAIIFYSNRGPGHPIQSYLMNADGSNQHPISR